MGLTNVMPAVVRKTLVLLTDLLSPVDRMT